MTIDEYLAELERRLPRGPGRRRILAEVEDHLRESASERGEPAALEEFGPAAAVAGAFSGSVARSLTRLAALVLLAALAFPVLTYPLVENGLPPAPWPSAAEMPRHLAWKQDAAGWLMLVALGAFASAALAWRQGRRSLVAPLIVGQGALTGVAVLSVILSVQWAAAVPGTPGWLLVPPLFMLALVLVAGGFLGRALLLR